MSAPCASEQIMAFALPVDLEVFRLNHFDKKFEPENGPPTVLELVSGAGRMHSHSGDYFAKPRQPCFWAYSVGIYRRLEFRQPFKGHFPNIRVSEFRTQCFLLIASLLDYLQRPNVSVSYSVIHLQQQICISKS